MDNCTECRRFGGDHKMDCSKRRTAFAPIAAPVVATVSTGHFEFLAVGGTANEAKAALLAAWERHREQYTGADPGYMRECILQGEVRFHFLNTGATRDGEPV